MADGEGRRIGPYVLGAEIGRGASGVVHAGTDERLGRRVALKALSEELAGSEEERARFAREARLLAAVEHPNVAVIYGVVEEEGALWLALELLDGESLAEVLERGPLGIEEALDVARQVAAALEEAHERGVVHRDLKPANVVRSPSGDVKVVDFGLARIDLPEGVAPEESASRAVSVVGTPRYLAPETLRGRPVDRRVDLWSLGCVLVELLGGRPAFDGDSGADLLGAILEHEPDLSRLPASTPERVRELVERLLAKDPHQRLRDAGDARLELERALAERAWIKTRGRGARSLSMGPGARVLPLAALVVAALSLGWWLGQRGGVTADADALKTTLRLRLAVPAGEKGTLPKLSPDGTRVVHEIATKRGRAGRYLVTSQLDSFVDVPIPGSERVQGFAFAPDGERLALSCASEGAAGSQLVLADPRGNEPAEFVTLLPERAVVDDMLWLEDGRVALPMRPRSLLLVHTDGSGRTEELALVLDESEWPYSPDLLDELPGRGALLARAFHMGSGRAMNALVAIDLSTGSQQVVLEGTGYGYWQPGGSLLFSRAEALFEASFDASSLEVGKPSHLADGLRTQSWSSGAFHASRTGAAVWWPGGRIVEGRRLFVVEGQDEPRPWSEDRLPVEGYVRSNPDQSWLTVVASGPAGNWELWGSELEVPNLRALLFDPVHDYRGGVVIPGGRQLLACRIAEGRGELVLATLTGPQVTERILYREESASTVLAFPVLDDSGSRLLVRRDEPGGTTLLAFEGIDAILESRSTDFGPDEELLDPEVVWKSSRSERLEVSPDGRWLLTGEANRTYQLRTLERDGKVGDATVVSTGGLEVLSIAWAVDSAPGSYRLLTWSEGTHDVHAISIEEGGEGLDFSEPVQLTDLRGKRMWDAAHLGSDRFLAVLMDADEMSFDTLHLLVPEGTSRP